MSGTSPLLPLPETAAQYRRAYGRRWRDPRHHPSGPVDAHAPPRPGRRGRLISAIDLAANGVHTSMHTTSPAYIPAITIGRGGTRAERSPEEQRVWADRVRAIAARADAALLAHGATPSDLVRPLPTELTDATRRAARSFFATLTAEQLAAITPAARGSVPTWGTVLDLYESASVYEGTDDVRAWDEYVPCAEALWPSTT